MTPADPPAPAGRSPALWASRAAGAALLLWIANSASVLESEKGEAWHHYEYLVDGFLQGHASLSVRPAPEMLALRDPYDPSLNGAWRLWDASLYNGRYYLYFGPTPVLLMLPWRVLAGAHMPERVAVAAFALLGLLALGLLIAGVRRRHFARLSPAAAGAILFVAMCASWLPVTLRRPEVWELPLVAACACLWWALYFLWRCLESHGGGRWAAGAGIAVALMMGARPTSVVAGAALVGLLATAGPGGRRPMLVAGSIAAAAGMALLAYNAERFGSPLEFGQSYQLWGGDERTVRHFSLAYAPYNAWLYLLSAPDLSPYFPFVLAVPPGGEPQGYVGIDEMHGALFAVPAQLAGLAALAWAWRSRADPGALALRRTVLAACASSALAACILFCYAGAASRYISELLAGATVACAVGLMALAAAAVGGRARNVLRLLAVLACAWTAAYVGLASAEHRILFRKTNPTAYAALARVLDYPSLWVARRQGAVFGPMDLRVRLAPYDGPRSSVLASSGRPGMLNQLVLVRTGPATVRLLFAENFFSVVAATPEIPVSGGTVSVRVEAPWLYPPPQHPWWDSVADPALRADLKTRFRLAANGVQAEAHTAAFFDPTRMQPHVLSRPQTGAAGWIESVATVPVPER